MAIAFSVIILPITFKNLFELSEFEGKLKKDNKSCNYSLNSDRRISRTSYDISQKQTGDQGKGASPLCKTFRN
jgi:hypothetical protein